jgi:hypothetical protein
MPPLRGGIFLGAGIPAPREAGYRAPRTDKLVEDYLLTVRVGISLVNGTGVNPLN